jgi:hypothetical protein
MMPRQTGEEDTQLFGMVLANAPDFVQSWLNTGEHTF